MAIDLISDILQDLIGGLSFQEVFDSIYQRLGKAIPCNRLAVALYEPGRDRLTLHACRCDGPTSLREGYSAPMKGSSLEVLMKTGEPRVLNDLEAYLAAKPASESTRLIVKEGMRSSLSQPLISRGRPIGVLFFSSRTAGAFTAAHVELSRLVAGHISVALERSMMAEELRASKEYLENILENSADAILVLDNDNRVRSWNRGAERMFGYRAEEILGKDYEIFVPQDRRAAGEILRIREIVEREGYLSGYETVRVAKDGHRLTISVTSTAIRDRAGRIVGRSSIVRDVTHLKRLQDDLARSQSLAAVGELAASVAHEIKNPLAGISGAIQVIADAIPPDDRRREIVGEILAQVRRLDDTVRDLLVFARPWKPEMLPVDLVDVIDRVTGVLRQEPKMSRVLLRRETPAVLSVNADPRLLQEVLINLLQNAADAMPGGGTVRICAAAEDGHVVLRVIDSGQGIPPEVRPRLFRPFFTTKTRGTGLGLAISKKIVEAHGGRIEIESEVGRGTEVRVTLCKEANHAAPSAGR